MTTTILIADASKPSLVMTSEVFKDKIPGAIVLVAKTGQEALDILRDKQPDMCVIDFDLPDADGVTLSTGLREVYKGPILLTAYPDRIVSEAVTENLFGFADAGGWLSKPINVEELNAKIEKFLLEKHRLGKRFTTSLMTQIIGKGAGRGKRSPKVKGKIVNLSIGGACVQLEKPMTSKMSEEITLSFALPAEPNPVKAAAKAPTTKGAKPTAKDIAALKRKGATATVKGEENKIKAKIAWTKKGGTMAGIQFNRLTPVQKKVLETYIKEMATSATFT